MARKQWWLAALLYGVTLIAYWPSLHGGFLWNDGDYVTARALRSGHGLWRIWSEVGAVQQYYPVLHSAFWIEHRLWGDSTLGYHLVNVLLHASAALLFGLVLGRLGSSATGSGPKEGQSGDASGKKGIPALPWEWVGAFLFALHPVCVESVAWISEEKNTLSTVFYLAAALAYLRFHDSAGSSSSASRYILATGLFVLALLSKSVAATLPAALLVVFWWRQGRLNWRSDIRPLLPWFAIGAAIGLFTAWVEYKYIGAEGEVFRLSFLQRCLVAGRAIWFYLGKLIWPHPLIFIYPRWRVSASAGWQYLYPIGVLALLAALWAWRRHSRSALAALLFFTGSLFPVLGFFNVYAFNFSYVADHFQYLPCLGVIALAVGGGGWLLRRLAAVDPGPSDFSSGATAASSGFRNRPSIFAGRWCADAANLRAFALVLAVALGALTWRQCWNYRDEQTFYRVILQMNPASWMAHNNLGVWLKQQGRTREARAEYEEALRLRPDYMEAQDNLGLILAGEARLPEAIDRYRAAVAIEPRFADAHRNLANALFHSGRTDEAFAQYEEALRLRGNDAHSWNDLGSALFALNRIPEAAERFRTALRFDPYFAEAHSNLGNALVKMGRIAEGVGEYESALQLDPDNGPARSNLGMALAQSGRLPEAMEQFQAALRSQPNFEEAHNNLGNVLLAMGRVEEADAQFQAALRINPNSAQANNNLGNVMFQTGRISEAVSHYEAALAINPSYFESQINLGVALCRLGRLEEGIAHFETALRIDPNSAQAQKSLERAEAMLRSRRPP